jgi:hypothetical protein
MGKTKNSFWVLIINALILMAFVFVFWQSIEREHEISNGILFIVLAIFFYGIL